MKHAEDCGTWRSHFQVWVRWKNNGEWQRVKCFSNADDARGYLTGGERISRIEMRERGASAGEAIYDAEWQSKHTTQEGAQ